MKGKHLFSSQLCRLKGVVLVQAQFFARCSSMADSDGRSKPAVTSRIRSRDQELGGVQASFPDSPLVGTAKSKKSTKTVHNA